MRSKEPYMKPIKKCCVNLQQALSSRSLLCVLEKFDYSQTVQCVHGKICGKFKHSNHKKTQKSIGRPFLKAESKLI